MSLDQALTILATVVTQLFGYAAIRRALHLHVVDNTKDFAAITKRVELLER